MMQWKSIGLVSFFVAAAACRSASPPVVALPPAVPDRSDSTWITMERGPCYGTCPVYALRISGAGAVAFQGKRFVQTLGVATAQMNAADLDWLRKTVASFDFSNVAPEYSYDTAACGPYVTDMPWASVTVNTRGVIARFHHDFGCGSAPPKLRVLELAIDSATHATRWSKGAPANQEK